MWMIRRLKALGANNNEQIDVDNWFMPKTSDPDNVQTSSDKTGLVTVNTRTKRYRKSPIPYLTEQLNASKK